MLKSLYHYTTEYGHASIIESGLLYPSLTKKNGRDVLFGEGHYFTNIEPETIVARSLSQMTQSQRESGQLSLLQLATFTMGGTKRLEKLDYFIQFDVSSLTIDRCTDYIYLHKSNIDLDVRDLITRSGKTLT